MKGLICAMLLFLLFTLSANAAIGCKVIGGSTIYPNFDNYLLGVNVNGVTIGIGANVYRLTGPLSTTVSCTVPYVNNYQIHGSGSCIYGTAAIAVPFVASVCNNCLTGELVDYTTTIQCNLDDYSLPLIAATGILGLLVIRKSKKK